MRHAGISTAEPRLLPPAWPGFHPEPGGSHCCAAVLRTVCNRLLCNRYPEDRVYLGFLWKHCHFFDTDTGVQIALPLIQDTTLIYF